MFDRNHGRTVGRDPVWRRDLPKKKGAMGFTKRCHSKFFFRESFRALGAALRPVFLLRKLKSWRENDVFRLMPERENPLRFIRAITDAPISASKNTFFSPSRTRGLRRCL